MTRQMLPWNNTGTIGEPSIPSAHHAAVSADAIRTSRSFGRNARSPASSSPLSIARRELRPGRPRPSLLGALAASGSLAPLDGMAGSRDDQFVGPSLATYRMKGTPLGAAGRCGVPGRRLASRPPRRRWIVPPPDGACCRSGAKPGVAASRHRLSGVHSLMTFFTLWPTWAGLAPLPRKSRWSTARQPGSARPSRSCSPSVRPKCSAGTASRYMTR